MKCATGVVKSPSLVWAHSRGRVSLVENKNNFEKICNENQINFLLDDYKDSFQRKIYKIYELVLNKSEASYLVVLQANAVLEFYGPDNQLVEFSNPARKLLEAWMMEFGIGWLKKSQCHFEC